MSDDANAPPHAIGVDACRRSAYLRRKEVGYTDNDRNLVMMQHFAVAFACRKPGERHSFCVYAQLLVQLVNLKRGVTPLLFRCTFASPFTCGIDVVTDPASPELDQWNSGGVQVVSRRRLPEAESSDEAI